MNEPRLSPLSAVATGFNVRIKVLFCWQQEKCSTSWSLLAAHAATLSALAAAESEWKLFFSPSVCCWAPNCMVTSVSVFTFPTSLVPLCPTSLSPFSRLQQTEHESVPWALLLLQFEGFEIFSDDKDPWITLWALWLLQLLQRFGHQERYGTVCSYSPVFNDLFKLWVQLVGTGYYHLETRQMDRMSQELGSAASTINMKT